MSDGLVIRALAADEVDGFRACMADTFGFDPDLDPLGDERLRALVDRARTYVAFDGALVVGTAAAYSFTMGVCGGVAPMAGLTQVTVRSTHRRRGILTRMIGAHLDDAVARGEPLSGLWASEGSIYGRFGYGVAAEGDDLLLTRDDGFAAGARDRIEQLDDAGAAAILPGVYARALPVRPGLFSRTQPWWHYRRFLDRVDQRKGRSPRRTVISRRGDEVTGYAVFRQKLGFDDAGRAAGQLDVEEMIALDAGAEASLWHHLTHTDLFPRITYWNAPTDSLAPWLARDRRCAVRRRRDDTLWLNVVDVAGALAARRYRSDGRLRFAVTGAKAPWELVVEGGVGRCAPSDAEPELVLERIALGSIYLGGVAPSLLARAGQIRGDDDALARADRLFGWPIAPWCAEIF